MFLGEGPMYCPTWGSCWWGIIIEHRLTVLLLYCLCIVCLCTVLQYCFKCSLSPAFDSTREKGKAPLILVLSLWPNPRIEIASISIALSLVLFLKTETCAAFLDWCSCAKGYGLHPMVVGNQKGLLRMKEQTFSYLMDALCLDWHWKIG